MLTGHNAFEGDTVSDVIAKVLEREPDWSLLPAPTPAAIRRLLLRCFEKNPTQRLRDIGEARIEIDAMGKALPEAPVQRRTPWLPWVALALLAGGIGVWDCLLYTSDAADE